jgi:hypothetical protein
MGKMRVINVKVANAVARMYADNLKINVEPIPQWQRKAGQAKKEN